MSRVLGVIPARIGSTRLPGKALLKLGGIPLVVRTLQNVERAKLVDEVVVATDDDTIKEVVDQAGGRAVMTSKSCPNGTMRVREAVTKLGESFDFVVNVQVDEPMMEPDHIDKAVEGIAVSADKGADVMTLAVPIKDPEDFARRDVVKCVATRAGRALYFSRSPIPYGAGDPGILKQELGLRHLGIYAFTKTFLVRKLIEMQTCGYESAESLEQLRWMYHGAHVHITIVDKAVFYGVDTRSDYERLKQFFDE